MTASPFLKSAFAVLGLPWREVRVPTRLQYQTTECGVAALAMVLAHYGKHVATEELRALTGVSRDCVNAADIARAARHHGLVCKAYSREPDQIESLPLPFLVHLRFIHFVVVEGFSGTDVLFNDPYQGPGQIPREQFFETFTGVVLTFRTGPNFALQPAGPGTVRALWQRVGPAARQAALIAGGAGLLAAAVLPTLVLAVGLWADARSVALPLGLLAGLFAALLAWRGHTLLRLSTLIQSGQAQLLTRRFLLAPAHFFVYRLPSVLHATLYSSETVARLCSQELLPGVLRLATVPLALGALAWLRPAVALVVAVPVLVCAAVTAILYRLLRSRSRLLQVPVDAMLASIEDLESRKLAGQGSEFIAEQLGSTATAQHARQETGEFDALLQAVAVTCALGGLGGVTLVAALGVAAPGASVGHTLTLLALTLIAVTPLKGIAPLLDAHDRLVHTLLPVDDVLACPVAQEHERCAIAAPSLPGHAVLRATDISFGYSTTRAPLLQGIDLTLAAGEQLGLTGPSGGGKSTLASLLAGHHPPWIGKLEYLQPAGEALRSQVAWVDRSTFFFEGTVRDNLCLWLPQMPPEQLARAVHDAGLDEVLAARPGGLDAPVLARARNFSGGQRQRLEIARALLREPRILVLDEATDGMDPALELQIRARLRERGCALIVVSHRASTLAACDRVLRVAGGRVQPWDAEHAELAPAAQAATGTTVDKATAGPPMLDIAAGDQPEGQADPVALDLVVRTIAGLLGVAAPLPSALDPPTRDLPALARRYAMVVRPVHFAVPRWRQRNHGPLLAFRQDTGAPLLVPGNGVDLPELKATGYRFTALDTPPYRSIGALLGRKIREAASELVHAACISVMAAALTLALPLWALRALDPAQPFAGNPWLLACALVALAAAAGLVDFGRSVTALRAAGRVELAALADLAQWTARLPTQALHRMVPADFVRSQSSIPHLAHRLLRGAVPQQTLDAITLLAALALLAWIDGQAALLAAALGAAGVLAPLGLTRQGRSMEGVQQRAAQPIRRLLYDVLAGIFRLRLLDAADRALSHWLALHAADGDRARTVQAIDAGCDWLLEAFPWLALTTMAVAATSWMHLPPWQLPVLLLALWPLLQASHGLGCAAVAWARTRHLAAQADAIAAMPLEPVPTSETTANLTLALQGISFAYPGSAAPVLQDLSLEIAAGEFIAITGPSGGGKSTLLRLMAGFEAPQTGAILWGDRPMNAAAWVAWRDAMAIVTQDEVMQASSALRHQIANGAPRDINQIWQAVQTALLDADIQAMPMGLQTIVESGKLSNGQEQRLFIARALLRKPRLLVLDEATNAVPDALQAALIANLRKLGITCILVTHRESALQLMDRVLVLEQGRLVWDGPPSLMQQRLAQMLRAERQQGHA